MPAIWLPKKDLVIPSQPCACAIAMRRSQKFSGFNSSFRCRWLNADKFGSTAQICRLESYQQIHSFFFGKETAIGVPFIVVRIPIQHSASKPLLVSPRKCRLFNPPFMAMAVPFFPSELLVVISSYFNNSELHIMTFHDTSPHLKSRHLPKPTAGHRPSMLCHPQFQSSSPTLAGYKHIPIIP